MNFRESSALLKNCGIEEKKRKAEIVIEICV